MKTLRVRILKDTGCFVDSSKDYYNMPKIQFFKYFFPSTFEYAIVDENDKADICIAGIHLTDKSRLRKNEVNILICIENCTKWFWYQHYNKYGNYGNDALDIYIYNHIGSISENPLAIPTINFYINYFNNIFDLYKSCQILQCPFKDKKFCLITNRSGFNDGINILAHKLSKYGEIDNIAMYSDDIKSCSCYNDLKLLEVLNKYKFIICFENSYNDGYITEKIFNCFLANTIPLYSGSNIVDKFFNTNSFINIPEHEINDFDVSTIKYLMNNEQKYNEMINESKINKSYDDENFMGRMEKAINDKLK